MSTSPMQTPPMHTSEEKARVWRLRAEEYRTAADNSKYEDSRQVYLTLARNYDQLADREERKIGIPHQRTAP